MCREVALSAGCVEHLQFLTDVHYEYISGTGPGGIHVEVAIAEIIVDLTGYRRARRKC